MPPRIVWMGPVAANQVGAAPNDVFLQCVGAQGTPICEDMVDAGGLSSLLAGKVPEGEPVVLRGYSAGGHAIKLLLRDPATRDRVAAAVLSDATYEKTKGGFDEGFVAYGSEAALEQPGRIFVATASSTPNPQGVTDSESLRVLRQKIEERTGRRFTEVRVPWAEKAPVGAWQLGRAMLIDFGSAYSHSEHATKLAVPVWKNVVEPWLNAPITVTTVSTASGGRDDMLALGLLVAGVGTLGLAAYLWSRQSRVTASSNLLAWS